MADELTHLDAEGKAKMVDVSAKDVTVRHAEARGLLVMARATLKRLTDGDTPKGDVLAVARVAGIQAAKRTPELIPLCHTVQITACMVSFRAEPETSTLHVTARVSATDRTGVEMEALTAVSVACLTVYDMLKAIDRAITIQQIALYEKSGGKSGDFRREP